jgi:hypothetical protein
MNEESDHLSHSPDSHTQQTRVTKLLRRAQGFLHNGDGKAPTHLEIAEWTGVARGTVNDWLNNKGFPTTEFALQLLERVPERIRCELLNSACRLMPSLEHPRIKCDQAILSRLKRIVREPRGLTVIQGQSDESRTFLLTALGHAYLGLTDRPHQLLGIDAHEPDWFVPLPGVCYLHNTFHPVELLNAVKANWPATRVGGLRLVVFNGVWPALVSRQRQFRALTKQCSVILAVEGSIMPSVLKGLSGGVLQLVTVSKHPENGKGIAVEINVI